jgi:hyaluronoglucosaminidase
MKRWMILIGIGALAAVTASLFWTSSEPIELTDENPGTPPTTVSQPENQKNNQASEQKQFVIRGVIEGFYGKPWTHEQRMDMFDFMSRNHYNTYVYAPKDDPYQRLNWFEAYPSEQASLMKDLIQSTESKGIRFVYSISPGIPIPLPTKPVTTEMEQKSISFSSKSDREKLKTKIDQLREMGVHTVMLSFDDVKTELKKEDQTVYGSDYALAHMELANELLQEMKQKEADFELWFAPTRYHGLKDNPYWQTLRSELDPSIEVIWTGLSILSKSIDSGQADLATQLLGRKPLIWDNFPVNDYTYEINKRPQIILGPIEFRSADLHQHTAGLLANPMIQPEASKLALYTIGQYLNQPASYDAKTAWLQALGNAEGVSNPGPLAKFSEYARLSALRSDPNPYFISLAGAYWIAYDSGEVGAEQVDPLRRELEQLKDLPKQLRSAVSNPELLAELDPWLNKLGAEGEAALLALEMTQLPKNDPKHQVLRNELEKKVQELSQNPLKIGEAVYEFAQRALTK